MAKMTLSALSRKFFRDPDTKEVVKRDSVIAAIPRRIVKKCFCGADIFMSVGQIQRTCSDCRKQTRTAIRRGKIKSRRVKVSDKQYNELEQK